MSRLMVLKYRIVFWALLVFLQSCTSTYYIVRHAEKSTTPPNDPLLTEKGLQRAQNLKVMLSDKKIERIYSTKTQRTMDTARPLAQVLHKEIEIYSASEQAGFIEKLKSIKSNSLIIGHSNTIRHIINGLAQKEILSKDLEDYEYDNVFVVKRKTIGKPKYETIKF